ncbi:MAG TPA: septal ring lytic transglycosylase RlpA family protein [Haliscomenobacter sp.]|nr:septal ring lytic transglycosylase RlpA family protein [Haliscomenobacter sp.]
MKNLLKVCGVLAVLFLNTTLLLAQQVEVGKANYYSDGLQGHSTAYGETYDRAQFTAAHRTYPKGTLLKITRLDNSKSVIVRVNDRGPFSNDGSLIALSMAAASQIDLTLVGNAQVKVEPYGYAETNAVAANYNTANSQSANAFAFDRIYNSAPAEVPQDYFTPRGTSGYPDQYSTNNTSTAQPQYGPVPPAYDRRFQNRSGNFTGSNEVGMQTQTPAEYGYTGNTSNNYNPGYSSNNTTTYNANPSASTVGNFPSLQAGSGFSVQIGAYSKVDNATRQAQSLVDLGLREIYIVQAPAANGAFSYRIFAGRFDNRDAALVYASQIKRQFLVNGFVLRM